MSRRFDRRPVRDEVPLEIAWAGGRDAACSFISFDEYPAIEMALAASRARGNAVINPDFTDGTDGWTAACEAGIARLLEDDVSRTFRTWGPRRYPDRDYALPASVVRGFAEHLDTTPAPPVGHSTYVVDPSRYSSRSGMAFDMRGMLRDVDAAHRAGRTVFHPMEGTYQAV